MYWVWVLWVGGITGTMGDILDTEFLVVDVNDNVTEIGSGEFVREPFRDIVSYPVCVTDEDCELSPRLASLTTGVSSTCVIPGPAVGGHSDTARGDLTAVALLKRKEVMVMMVTATDIMTGGTCSLVSVYIRMSCYHVQ